MASPRIPITKEAKQHLEKILRDNQANGLVRKKYEKRCEMYDRGFKGKESEVEIN